MFLHINWSKMFSARKVHTLFEGKRDIKQEQTWLPKKEKPADEKRGFEINNKKCYFK